MHRFYCYAKDVAGNEIVLTDRDQIHHIKDVIRLAEGEESTGFDEKGCEYRCRIVSVSPERIVFSVKERKAADTSKTVYIAVACAIPKHSKIDDCIDKLTQLGVDRIIPLMTERVIVRMDRDKMRERLARWKSIALAATKQCQRNIVPVVDPVTEIQYLIESSKEFDGRFIPTLPGDRRDLKDVLRDKKFRKVLILIGPEGDFTPEETDAALAAGFVPVSFGDFVFRVETAAVFAASVLHYELR